MSLSSGPTPPCHQEAGPEGPTVLPSQLTAAFHLTEMKTLKHWIDLAFINLPGAREGGCKTPFYPVIFCTVKTYGGLT